MKKWVNPEVEILDMTCTEYDKKYLQVYDDVRVEQNERYLFRLRAKEAVPFSIGKVEKID